MSREELRKVIVDVRKMSGYTGVPYEAYFHQFGLRKVLRDDSMDFATTVAIVESRETGEVKTVEPYCLKFVEQFDGEDTVKLGKPLEGD